MANYIFPPTDENEHYDEAVNKMKTDYGSDAYNVQNDEYNMELFPEMIPKTFSWVLMDEQRERVKEIIGNDEKLWRD